MISRNQIVTEARSWIGTPYLHQGAMKGVGCDCLGLVRGVWRSLYGRAPETPPPYSADWAESGGAETLRDAALRHLVPVELDAIRKGDVLLFRWRPHVPAKHLAIVVEAKPQNMRMVHAHDGASVCEVAVSKWWRRHLAFAFSFPDCLDN